MPPSRTPPRHHIASCDLIVAADRLVVAGYTGRDAAAVQHHIDELAAIGVPAPETVPAFYDLDPSLLTTAYAIQTGAATTSGEVEPVLIRSHGHYYLTVGSDHTDRELEREGIQQSKAACPKPVAPGAIDLGENLDTLDFDAILARSWVDGELYQEGPLVSLLPIREVADSWDRLGLPSTTLVLFGGTLPLLNGTFRYGHTWRIRLDVPDHESLDHTYHVTHRSN
jgi:hypothetical protein